jgi:hypothetical protein
MVSLYMCVEAASSGVSYCQMLAHTAAKSKHRNYQHRHSIFTHNLDKEYHSYSDIWIILHIVHAVTVGIHTT